MESSSLAKNTKRSSIKLIVRSDTNCRSLIPSLLKTLINVFKIDSDKVLLSPAMDNASMSLSFSQRGKFVSFDFNLKLPLYTTLTHDIL